jgi:O-acetyl-ADP-ribose deacetylase (regulator of RNase III)
MHQANCFSTMGAGIAKLIAELYPEAEIADREYIDKPEDKLGKFSFATVKNITIVNLYGQFHYGRGKQTNYKMLEKAINDFIEFAKENKINMDKIGVPYKMGCGLAGGDWVIVEKILFEQSEKHNLNIYIYQL